MRYLIAIALALWPILVPAQWVQVGFVEADLGVQTPGNVVVTDELGSWQRELTLQDRYDVKFGCMVSEPLVLPKHTSDGNFNIRWEQGGLEFSYQFKPLVGQPLQILLEQPAPETKPEAVTTQSEVVVTLAPNPFNPTSKISLELPEASHLRLEVFDILGRSVSLLTDSELTAGTHHWVVDGSTWASGTYFLSYRLSLGQSGVRRMQLLSSLPLLTSLFHCDFGVSSVDYEPMPVLIGIAGGSASGKTTLANGLVRTLGQDRVLYLLQDSYYRELKGMTLEQRAQNNFDHPDAFETSLLCKHLDSLLAGETVVVPDYDYATHLRKPTGQRAKPHEIILLDGIMVLHEPELRARMSLKVFLDSWPKICLKRRIDRDTLYRDRTEAEVIRQFTTQVEPMYKQFVEPSKVHADIVIEHDEEMNAAIERVADSILHRV